MVFGTRNLKHSFLLFPWSGTKRAHLHQHSAAWLQLERLVGVTNESYLSFVPAPAISSDCQVPAPGVWLRQEAGTVSTCAAYVSLGDFAVGRLVAGTSCDFCEPYIVGPGDLCQATCLSRSYIGQSNASLNRLGFSARGSKREQVVPGLLRMPSS